MHRIEGDFVVERDMAKLLRDQDWRDGLISDATYVVSLICLGYHPRDARTELNLLKLAAPPLQTDQQMEDSRAWLRSRRQQLQS